jgi:hypothetical protein
MPAHQAEEAPREQVMKIRFERTGGFAGLIVNVEVDAGTLLPAQSQALAQLVERADFFELPAAMTESATQGADRFSYRITIEADGRTHTVETTDSAAPAALVPLLEWLELAARQASRDARAPR